MYKVDSHKKAVKDLENIDGQMRNRIAVKLWEYANSSLDIPELYAMPYPKIIAEE